MKYYDRFLKQNLNLAPVGFGQGDANTAYFCTPKGAKILGWAGVDGIHYCFVRGFGEMVFAVSPANLPGDYVHPIARSFEDLLRLLLACGDMAAIEQAHAWDRAEFDDFLKEIHPTSEQEEALGELKNRLALSPMEDPFGYIKTLQKEFDYHKITFTSDYYDWEMNAGAPEQPAEWKVYYGGGYWGGNGRKRAGRELRLDKQFVWGNEIWHVPAYYYCSDGLVVDFCIEIDRERMRAFLNRWAIYEEATETITERQRARIERENPMEIDFRPVLYGNGREMKTSFGSGLSWLPEDLLQEGTRNAPEALPIVEHYGLDRTRAWSFHRWSFPWNTKRKPVLRSLRLKLERNRVSIEGIHFRNPSVGDEITFTHPVFGTVHRLRVQEYEKQEMQGNVPGLADEDLPRHYTIMAYALEPDLTDSQFLVQDCAENDAPRKMPHCFEAKAKTGFCAVVGGGDGPKEEIVSAVGGVDGPEKAVTSAIIGGADGPTAVFIAAKKGNRQHAAISALHFEPVDDVEWQIVFREKPIPDYEIDLFTESEICAKE